MRITVAPSALAELLQIVVAAAPSKSTLQICHQIHLEVRAGELFATATDLDLATRMAISVESDGEGAFCAPARKLLEVVKELPEGEPCDLLVTDNQLKLASGTFRASIAIAPADEFPQPPQIDGPTALVPRGVLATLLGSTAFAVSHEATRMSLNGVLWEPSEGSLTAVATDGHRMGYASVACASSIGSPAILPPKAMQMLLRAVVDPEAEVELTLGDTAARLKAGLVEVYSKLIEGPYPNYRQVVPKAFATTLEADKAALLAAVRRVQTLVSAATRSITLDLPAGEAERRLAVSSVNLDLGGSADDAVEVTALGPGIRWGLNCSYLLEILALVPGPRVRIQLNTPVQAVLISAAEDKPSSWWIQMPLKLID